MTSRARRRALGIQGTADGFVRTLVTDTIERAGLGAVDALDSWSAVLLAEQLELPLLTTSDEVNSEHIDIYRPW